MAKLTKNTVDIINDTAPLTLYGMSSLRAFRLHTALERKYGVDAPLTLSTVDAIVKYVQHSANRELIGGSALERPVIIGAGSSGEPFPLTDLQHAYLVGRTDAYQLGGLGGHAYFELRLDDVDFERDIPALGDAWQSVVRRHEALRLIVTPDGRQRVQLQVAEVSMQIMDLRESDLDDRTDALRQRREALSHESFDLMRWPLHSISVTLLPNATARLHLSVDLFVADLWGLRILMHDWWCYFAAATGRGGVEPEPLDIGFRDVVLAERAYRDSDQAEGARAYWARRIEEFPAAPLLPATIDSAKKRFSRRSFRLSETVWQRIVDLAARRSITQSGALLAAYSTVLARWSESAQFTIDVTLFNRPPLHPDIEKLVGDFTNVDLLEVDVVAASSFADLATSVQSRLWDDLRHAAGGGVSLLHQLGARRGMVGQAIMPVVFTSALGSEDEGFSSLSSGFGAPEYVITQTPQLYLDHQVFTADGGLLVVWDTRDGVLDDHILDEMIAAYEQFLASLSDESTWLAPPRVTLSSNVIGVREEQRAIAPLPTSTLIQSILDRFDDRGVPAVITSTGVTDFASLAAMAIGIGNRLRSEGIGVGDVVGVLFPKGLEQIAATLGVLASGAAYLPLDPELPQARITDIVDRAQVRLVLDEQTDLSPADADQIAGWRCPAGPDDLAYVLYTSGSTGAPKGVAVSHRAAANTVHNVANMYGVSEGDRVFGISALSFDLSVWDLFGALPAGAALVLPDDARRKDPSHWLQLILDHNVTLWNSVPAMAEMLLNVCTDYTEIPLRLVLLSGDWIPLRLPDRIKIFAPQARVVGLGGPTETSVWTNFFEIDEVSTEWRSIPYGWELPNHRLLVCNDRLEEVPSGVTGEIYVAGAGLAEGYYRDPELTASFFVKHPDTGERLYRSGDLARRGTDGCLEILGRVDDQLKVAGHRIEAGEVERVLAEDPRVAEAIVVTDGRQLVGYVVSRTDSSHEELSYVKELLDPRFGDEVLTDPVKRLQFKLSDPGVQHCAGVEFDLPDVSRTQRQGSVRAFAPTPIAMADLAKALIPARSIRTSERALPQRGYASAGMLYPVGIYLFCKPHAVAGLDGGSYYYHPLRHALIRLGELDLDAESAAFAMINRQLVADSPIVLFFISDYSAITPLYGSGSAEFSLIEAGLLTQAIESSIQNMPLGMCHLGQTEATEGLRSTLRLKETQHLVHSAVLGPIAAGMSEELIRRVAGRLPSYMVPHRIIELPELPLTTRDKVDRAALRARIAEMAVTPETIAARELRHEKRSAEGNLEETVCRIVAEVINRPSISPTDKFLEAGATSVDLTSIYAKLRPFFDDGFDLLALFEYPDARSLAANFSESSEKFSIEHIADDVRPSTGDLSWRIRGRMRRNARPSDRGNK